MSDELLQSWARSKRAQGRSQGTIDAYTTDVGGFVAWLGDGADVCEVKGRQIEDYLATGLEQGLAPATIARRYRSLLQFYKWATDEEEVAVNPMAKMKPPKVVAQPPPVISADVVAKLLAACDTPRGGLGRAQPSPEANARKTFENKRDRALIMLLVTTGIRAGELMGLELADLDLKAGLFTVMGKGGRARIVSLMPKPAEALDRYRRERSRHPQKALPWLWLGEKGRLTDSGLRQLLERRCDDAGVERINPHRFRHTFAHEAKSRGMSDGDLMSIAGWQSPQMLQRYGASAAAERARDAHMRLFGKD